MHSYYMTDTNLEHVGVVGCHIVRMHDDFGLEQVFLIMSRYHGLIRSSSK